VLGFSLVVTGTYGLAMLLTAAGWCATFLDQLVTLPSFQKGQGRTAPAGLAEGELYDSYLVFFDVLLASLLLDPDICLHCSRSQKCAVVHPSSRQLQQEEQQGS
jgi:hypothetical protein